MRFSETRTVPHGSTKFFPSHGNLHEKFWVQADSEREAARVSSVEDVTATGAVQVHEAGEIVSAGFLLRTDKVLNRGGVENGPKRTPTNAAQCAKCAIRLLFLARLCPDGTRSFILTVCLNTVEGTRSSYLSCPSVHSNLTGASEARSMDFARA